LLQDDVLGSFDHLTSTGRDVAQPPHRKPMTLVVAMTLADGNLFDLLLPPDDQQQRMQVTRGDLLRYVEDSARAVDYLNSPRHDLGSGPVAIQHCDINPQNIVLVGDSAMVCDFGLARVLTDSHVSSHLSGT